jgi:hypothetical protein
VGDKERLLLLARIKRPKEAMMQKLERTMFETSRTAEYFSVGELAKQTGQEDEQFGAVVVKELVDNGLDAAEAAGVAPCVEVGYRQFESLVELSVSDNGPGIPPEAVEKIVDFTTRTSDKAHYRSPTRGAQGNALKTVIGIPYALGCAKPVVVEARGVRHIIKAAIDPAGELRLMREVEEADRSTGTKVTVPLPHERICFDPSYWAGAFSLFNPHAFIKLECFGDGSDHGESGGGDTVRIYKPTAPELAKYRPTEPTSPHWYDTEAMGRLIGAHIGHAKKGGENLALGKFIRQFKGLKSTAKAKVVCQHLGPIGHLSDFERDDHQLDRTSVGVLLRAMWEATSPPTHKMLGRIGEAHFRRRFDELYGGELVGYKYVNGYLPSGLPYVFEFALAEIDDVHHEALFYGVNYSPTFGDPLEDLRLKGPEYSSNGVKQFLIDGYAHPKCPTPGDPGPRGGTAAAVHIVTPAPLFMERGKSRLGGLHAEGGS